MNEESQSYFTVQQGFSLPATACTSQWEQLQKPGQEFKPSKRVELTVGTLDGQKGIGIVEKVSEVGLNRIK